MRPKYAQRQDGQHNDICDELRRQGVEVVDCSGSGEVPDLLVRWRDQVSFIEIKEPGSKAKWTFTQLKFIADTRFDIGIAKSPSDAIYALKNRVFLTSKQKDAIAGMLIKSPKKFYQPSEVEKAISV
jgi:hypothetical protein